MRVRLDGRRGGLIESEAFWIHVNRETEMPARISDDFLAAFSAACIFSTSAFGMP